MNMTDTVQLGMLVAIVILAGVTYYLFRLRSREIEGLTDAVRRLLLAEVLRASQSCRNALLSAPEDEPLRTPPEGCGDVIPPILKSGYGPLRYLSDPERELAGEFSERLAELRRRATQLRGVDLRQDLEGVVHLADRLIEALRKRAVPSGSGPPYPDPGT